MKQLRWVVASQGHARTDPADQARRRRRVASLAMVMFAVVLIFVLFPAVLAVQAAAR